MYKRLILVAAALWGVCVPAVFAQETPVVAEPQAVVSAAVPVVSGAQSAADVQLPVDLKRAADIALTAFGGEVVKAEEVSESAGLFFHIRLVNNGRVRDVVVDAANGEIVKPREE